MWGLPWDKGRYRLENVSQLDREKIRRGDEAVKRMLAELECQWCHEHGEPAVNSRGQCVYCEDSLM